MKSLHFLLLGLFLSGSIYAQERRIPGIPDIPGYKTLLCDFHLHTVFSDGYVWPSIRVDEAWREGLDAIAITDHLEYQPHKKDVSTDHNRSSVIAKEYAKDKDLIVIAGTEITKGMPPGHLNALFVQDADRIYNEDFKLACEEAAGQGAFIMWNHPGWKAQQPDTMRWWDEHSWLNEKGWLHGIEVVNYGEFYPMAVNWALDRNLAMIGSSDRHGPFLHESFDIDDHRSMTLVFATEKSEGGIREALFNKRTAAFNGNDIIGPRVFLEALFLEAINMQIHANNTLSLKNSTDLRFELILSNTVYDDFETSLTLNPHSEFKIELPAENALENISITVTNLVIGAGDHLSLPLVKVNKIQD